MHKFIRTFLILSMVSMFLGLQANPVSAQSEILLTKTASSDNATMGDSVTYTYIIANNTSDNLTGLELTDDKIGEITILKELPAGESITATASYTVSLADYSNNATELVNIATLTSNENMTATASASVTLNKYQASLQVTKTADKHVATYGDKITYTYIVTNNSTVTITDISLDDDKLGNIPLLSDNSTVTSLEPGKNITAVATYEVVFADLKTGAIKNTATVTGIDPSGNAITASSGEVKVDTKIIKALLSKAQLLQLSGVNGKGIENAPGLHKQFNPNSQAIDHAGKKEAPGKIKHLQKKKHYNQETGDDK